MRLRAKNYYATEFGVHITPQHTSRRASSAHWQRKSRFSETHDTSFLLHTLAQICDQTMPTKPMSVSIWLSGLVEQGQCTPDLFENLPALEPSYTPDIQSDKRERLLQTIDQINRTYGKNTIFFASSKSGLDLAPMRIAFSHIPDLDNEK